MMCHAGLRRRRPAHERVLLLPRDLRRRLRRPRRERRPRRRADARPEHRERPGRGDRAQLPGARRAALARRGLGRRRALPRRARAAQGLPLRPPDDVHRARRPDDARARRARFGGHDGQVGRVRPRPRRRGAAARRRRRRSTLEAGDVVSYRTCGGGGYGPPEERDPERVLRDVLEEKVSVERARERLPRSTVDADGVTAATQRRLTRGAAPGSERAPAIDPITFEVIRNALVAATDEMVLALKRSAYSTNIKTRSDFSCAFFDAELRVGRPGRSPSRCTSARWSSRCRTRSARYGAENLGPGRRDRHERPVPERRPPERRQPDLAGPRATASCSATSRTSPTTSTSAAARRRASAPSARSSRRA